MKQTKYLGFTLIELMLVMVITLILAGVAVSVYSRQIVKGRRADGLNTLLAISLAEERYRSNNTSYAALNAVWPTTTSPQGYYTLAASSVSATGYTLTATGTGTQTSDTENGTSCSTLTLTVSNGTITRTPAACWPN